VEVAVGLIGRDHVRLVGNAGSETQFTLTVISFYDYIAGRRDVALSDSFRPWMMLGDGLESWLLAAESPSYRASFVVIAFLSPGVQATVSQQCVSATSVGSVAIVETFTMNADSAKLQDNGYTAYTTYTEKRHHLIGMHFLQLKHLPQLA
jgi:hypothetical protein